MPDSFALQSRIGFLMDGIADTDLMSAVYEHDALGVRVRVPYHVSADDVRSRWWSPGIMFADDPDRSKYSYDPPSELDYYDSEGAVGLVGCRGVPAKQRFSGGKPAVGVGIIRASYAVEGAGLAENYVKLNGLRSDIDGLAYWLGYSALTSTFSFKKDGTGGSMTTTAEPVDDMKLGRSLNLRAVARASSSGQQTPEVTYRSEVFLQTFTKTSTSWDDHLTIHFGVRNLLRIAAWKPLSFQSHAAASTKEAFVLKEVEQQPWYPVRTARTSISEAIWAARDRFLFTYADIGRVGVGRWLKLASRYARGIDPLIHLLDLEGATIDAHVMQLGVALEAVGYQALIDAGQTPAVANAMNVKGRIDLLIAEVGNAVTFSTTTFAQDLADSYNSVKHANRAPVAPAKKLEHYRRGVQLLRAWIGLRLGVKEAVIRDRW
ncbi:HEPN domain-containing protein [Microbacterium sp. Leaf179]|uniref:ApeA N-terminal domain 1-containing protein n=1 Tax=Microbacterium sp. Leaf179 TaxID=1736288 RepID=UPI0012E33CB5|nr:HEPN domain-containing protein [Microbacterium sp. Leaf179]